MADKAEKDLEQASDCSWVRGLDANGNPIKIAKAELVELIRTNMPVATNKNGGLMGADNIFNRGNLMGNNLKEVGSSFGYTYASDGSGLDGTFLSIKDEVSGLQFKAHYAESRLSFRTFNHVDGFWNDWKSISFT